MKTCLETVDFGATWMCMAFPRPSSLTFNMGNPTSFAAKILHNIIRKLYFYFLMSKEWCSLYNISPSCFWFTITQWPTAILFDTTFRESSILLKHSALKTLFLVFVIMPKRRRCGTVWIICSRHCGGCFRSTLPNSLTLHENILHFLPTKWVGYVLRM